MFGTVLVANRGEIAVRVIRTLHALGIRAIAVYSDADAGARHVAEADQAIRLGPARAAESYLSIDRVLAAAVESSADAIHPGYGFLSENADFARACERTGVVFVGPHPAAIETMGDKISAKRTVEAAGVPVVPGLSAPGLSDDDLIDAAGHAGFPLLLKPSAGGGGKGMRLVHEAGILRDEIAAARREARGAFGDDTLMIERFIDSPRHIEIQVLADTHGAVIHLGERECSLQRRHQKIIEEAPSPLLDAGDRARLGDYAVKAAQACGYTGAGTVEFIADARSGERYFLEMNTRLQVEHPVTEMVTGLDLVEWQLRVAAGEQLASAQRDVRLDGHAIEARVYAEDPNRGFLPTGGSVLRLREPDLPYVRVDSGLSEGTEIGSTYDPMLAKIVAWGPDRETARSRLDGALAGTTVLGLTTNLPFLRVLLSDQEVQAGRLDTGLVERRLESLPSGEVPDQVLAAGALERLLALEPRGRCVDPWDVPNGWRAGEHAWTTWRIEVAGREPADVRVRGRASAAEVVIGDELAVPASVSASSTDPGYLVVTYGDRTMRYDCARVGPVTWLGSGGRAWALREWEPLEAPRTGNTGVTGGPVRAPMPGTVLAIKVSDGDPVTAGQPLVIVEAMKMEHTVTAPADGVAADVRVRVGQQVGMDEPLATVIPPEPGKEG